MLRFTSLTSLRLISFGLLLALLISSCSPLNPTDIYPTYDPFAPLNGTAAPGAVPVGDTTSANSVVGSTPTRASLSVPLPTRNPQSAGTTPTPDNPHPLPTQRDFLDQHAVQ